jgi:outer membrane biosynthesis protein TonB
MLPGTEKRKPRNSSKVNLLISLAFHSLIVLSVFYFAAREGWLGKPLQTIAVDMVKEKPAEKPKEPVKPKADEPPKVEPPKLAEATKPAELPKMTQAPPPAAAMTAPPAIAPPAAEAASFEFEGGKVVETSSDPVELFKGLLQSALQSSWARPEDLDDQSLVAEVEVAVDSTGHIADPVWKKSSGQKRWDDSVRQAIAKTRSVSRAPPPNFPSRVVVRFDVVASEPVAP